MICDAGTTCFKSKKADVLAAIDTLPSKSMLLIVIDAVTAAVVGLQMTMFVTTAVLPDGVVYRVVDVVAAAGTAGRLGHCPVHRRRHRPGRGCGAAQDGGIA